VGVTTQGMPDQAAAGFPAPGFGTDLSAVERPELERALTDLQARYRGLIDHLPAVIYLYRFGDGTMVEVSPGIRQLLGIEPEAWLNDPEGWYASIHPDDLARVVDESGRCIEAGVPFRLQYRAVRADGETIWISEETAIVPDEHGAPVYWLGLMLDVSKFVRTTCSASRPTSTWPTPTCGPSTSTPMTAMRRSPRTWREGPPVSHSRSSTGCSHAMAAPCGSATARSWSATPRAPRNTCTV
jgi:PAS domain S-box-containing protein